MDRPTDRLAFAEPFPLIRSRWMQMVVATICMMAISSPQYVWALFTRPLMQQLGASLSAVQVTFSILIVLQTFFSPFQGYLIDRFGPRTLIAFGELLTGASWFLASQCNDVMGLYLSYGLLGGIGTGIVYVGVVGLMVRWFPRQRGLAAGVAAAGYGFGAILTTLPISASLATSGLADTLRYYGFGIAAVGVLVAQFLRDPGDDRQVPGQAGPSSSSRSMQPAQMLRTRVFWLMFFMMTMMSTSGLMVTSQMGAFMRDFGLAQTMVWGQAALALALTLDRFTNGLTRPFFGFISDRIGRENTMFIAFLFEGIAMALWLATRENVVLFVLLSGVVFFGWGEIFSLFPATLTDTFGQRHATTNYGCLYIAQGIGAIFGGPLAALLREQSGSWIPVFVLAVSADILTALLAISLLKRWRLELGSVNTNDHF